MDVRLSSAINTKIDLQERQIYRIRCDIFRSNYIIGMSPNTSGRSQKIQRSSKIYRCTSILPTQSCLYIIAWPSPWDLAEDHRY